MGFFSKTPAKSTDKAKKQKATAAPSRNPFGTKVIASVQPKPGRCINPRCRRPLKPTDKRLGYCAHRRDCVAYASLAMVLAETPQPAEDGEA